MIRALAHEEIERVLRAEVVGRIGCHANGRTYVVPVCYAYEAGAIYAHSGLGLKIEMMRQNPSVCFEVDHVEDLANWDSAICWGRYEELSRADAEHGLELIRSRILERMPRTFDHGMLAGEAADGDGAAVVFRLNLTELTGREERLYWDLLPIALEGDDRAANRWPSRDPALVERQESARTPPRTPVQLPSSEFVPEDVLAERDYEARAYATWEAES